MSTKITISALMALALLLGSCSTGDMTENEVNIIFLHHSTGDHIWNGQPPSFSRKVIRKLSPQLDKKLNSKGLLPSLFNTHNETHKTNYEVVEQNFPKVSPYGWNNYPFDYYNIWVKHAGNNLFKEEPTLELLSPKYDVIVFKHCYPVSSIVSTTDSNNIESYQRTLGNYKLQYLALRDKLHTFPQTKFILFTGPVQVQANLETEEALRAKKFYDWVVSEWDQPDDNIFLWDLYALQTEGGLFFKDEHAVSPTDSHPNKTFSTQAAKLLFERIIDITENSGKNTLLTGHKK
ncbi:MULTISPECIES: hypothetical protein [unclassified Carboxylicivirga]|uniref:hypothetical protein n=1 Tax=Carboxylicivirga TaxID=1628153 RepID=UPI003D33ED39